MENDTTLTQLRDHIKRNGGVASFAASCEASARLVYSWLDGSRRIHPRYAERIEVVTKRKFKKERLPFAKAHKS